MKLYLENFSVVIDLNSESVVGISIDGNCVHFIHSDSTITTFLNGNMDCYRFGNSIKNSDYESFYSYFKDFNKRKFLKYVSQKNDFKRKPETLSALRRRKKT